MKKQSKWVALIIALIMLVSSVSTCVFASEKAVDDEKVYVALGDSVSRGCGATEDYRDEYTDLSDRTVTDSFPLRVAQGLGVSYIDDAEVMEGNNYWPVCSAGQTLSMTLDLMGIEDGYYDEDYDHGSFGGNYGELEKYYGNPLNLCMEADVITVELGMCDVMYKAIPLTNLEVGSSEITAEWVGVFLKNVYAGYDYWQKSFPLLLNALTENTGAKIILVGAYRLGNNMPLIDEYVVPSGNVAEIVPDMMNAKYQEWADQYDNVYYCDIRNVETPSSEYGYSLLGEEFAHDGNLLGHPSIEGNAYIARQVLALLKETENPEAVSTDISFDLGHRMQVSYVFLDGKCVKNFKYEDDNRTLTVQNSYKKCFNLTCGCIEDKRLVVYTYRLSYNPDKGYTALRIWNTRDAGATVQKARDYFKNIGNAIKKTFFGK